MTAFKIGSVYAMRTGGACRILRERGDGVAVGWADHEGHEFLSDWCLATGEVIGCMHDIDLLPGELHKVGDEWVPVARGVEEKPVLIERIEPIDGPFFVAYEIEPARPALTWNTKTAFDQFPGYSVLSETTEQDKSSHPLQKMSEVERIGGWVLGR